jgi:phospholipid/cholesterol/gamma-HCH transport system substrate-binding protein
MIVKHQRAVRIATAISLAVTLAAGIGLMATSWWKGVNRSTYTAYFANTNGLYTGDEVRILGVAVGTVERIDPQPNAAKVTFTVDSQYSVPADAQAAVRWLPRAQSSWFRLTPAVRNSKTAQPFRRTAPRFPSSGTICARNWRS